MFRQAKKQRDIFTDLHHLLHGAIQLLFRDSRNKRKVNNEYKVKRPRKDAILYSHYRSWPFYI